MSGQRKALIIANDEYEQEALHNLLAPGADAEALGRVLGDAQIGDFCVQVVRNEPSYVIEARIEDLFSESRPDDLLLLHFSGHGLKSESGELFFAAANTKPNRLGSTAVSADFVQRCMRDSRSRSIVLLLDCCYGGAFAQGVKVRAAGDVNVLDSFPQGRSGGRGRAVITASSAMEYAFEGDRLADDQHQRPSVFTGVLVEGLITGDADRDEDGLVSLNELYDYVFDKVRERNPHQTPSRQVELEGELYLARSRRRRIRPAPIPPDLQAAITDPNMYTRRGAVHELQSRLASDDLPVAAGAYQALAELARTDIQYVADLAAAALSQAAVHPEETELHFGQHRQGSAPPHRLIRLTGLPIARACTPHASHDWIRVNETSDGFDISVDTTSTGTLHGSVDLKGPTGAAVIAIDVELLPRSGAASQQAAEPHQDHAPPTREPSTAPSPAQTLAPSRTSTPAPDDLMAAITLPAARPEERAPAGDRQQSPQAAEREAAEQSPAVATAAQPRTPKPRTSATPTASESAVASPTTPAAPPGARPPIRRGVAYTGTVTALLAGIGGIISQLVYFDNLQATAGSRFFWFLLSVAIYGLVAIAALIALARIYRLIITGFLQGMLWLGVSSLVAIIASLVEFSAFNRGQVLAGLIIEAVSLALGVTAAILLMISWSPAAERRQARQIRGLPLMLVGVAGLSQIPVLIFYVRLSNELNSSYYYYAQASVGVLVAVAITWYAMSLRTRALGGALVLGWVTAVAMVFAIELARDWPFFSYSFMSDLKVYAILGYVLLAAVVTLTIIYVRKPSDTEAVVP